MKNLVDVGSILGSNKSEFFDTKIPQMCADALELCLDSAACRYPIKYRENGSYTRAELAAFTLCSEIPGGH